MKSVSQQIRYLLPWFLLVFEILLISCSSENGIEPIGTDPCSENPCANPELCSQNCNDSGVGLSRKDLEPQGNITETANGYLVDGSLTITPESGEPIVLTEADLDVEFNEDGTLKSISGTSEVPSSSNYFEFENPIQADIGYFTGRFLNQNRSYEIKLVDDFTYFVFAISVGFELKLGANDNPDAQKPLSIEAPIGGHIAYIADYNDPMFFFSIGGDTLGGDDQGDDNNDDNNGNGNNGGSDGNNGGDGNNNGNSSHTKLGGVSFGASLGANFHYTPTNPVNGNIISFPARVVTGGSVSFFNILETKGMLYQNLDFSADLDFNEPLNSDYEAGYQAGINGTLDLSLGITSFISFGFPIASGSAAVVAEGSNEGVMAKAFINGLVDPDLSWWPDFVPVVPDGDLNAYGSIVESGFFDIGLSGSFSMETPTTTHIVEGMLRATPEAFTMDGRVTNNDEIWEANVTFTKDQTKAIATPPVNFTNGISETVTAQIDEAIETTEKALADLEAANEQYEFELSLRGLRVTLPGIISDAEDAIDDAVSSTISAARTRIDNSLDDNDRVRCSDNLSGQLTAIVRGHRNALTRLSNAVNTQNDNETTRTELEGALRDLAAMDRITRTFSVSVINAPKLTGCSIGPTRTDSRSESVNRQILTAAQKAQLLEAADNVQFIAEADGIRFDAQVIVDQLPTIEELETLRDGAEVCVSELTEGIEKSGFTYIHDTGEFIPFIVINGEEKEVEGFDIFSSDELVAKARIETDGCNPNQALKRLQVEAAAR
ncbi:MAG: hypothetical protein AAGA43_06430 [Bacteroidota bacterium]